MYFCYAMRKAFARASIVDFFPHVNSDVYLDRLGDSAADVFRRSAR